MTRRGGRIRLRVLYAGPASVGVALVLACGGADASAGEDPSDAATGSQAVAGPSSGDSLSPVAADPNEGAATGEARVRPERVENELTRGDTVPGHPSWTRQDLAVLEATVAWARRAGIDTLPVGERVARIGQRFVGAPYVPQTLDPPGPERLVVNLRAFDCVTFVESALTLAHVVTRPAGAGDGSEALMRAYEEILTSLRYRHGRLEGYPSRLHYFSEWISDNETKGYVEDVTAELGGVPDAEPLTFMTEHRDAYRQLGDRAHFAAVVEIEARLADVPRHVIPEDRVKALEDRVRSGDVIAATSTLPGLDVAHTGIAVRRNGVLRLMHAPLVGEAVQVSESSLGERLLGLSAQDGIMVARPRPGPASGDVPQASPEGPDGPEGG